MNTASSAGPMSCGRSNQPAGRRSAVGDDPRDDGADEHERGDDEVLGDAPLAQVEGVEAEQQVGDDEQRQRPAPRSPSPSRAARRSAGSPRSTNHRSIPASSSTATPDRTGPPPSECPPVEPRGTRLQSVTRVASGGGAAVGMASMARILVTEEIADGGLDRLRAAGHEVDVRAGLSPDELLDGRRRRPRPDHPLGDARSPTTCSPPAATCSSSAGPASASTTSTSTPPPAAA